MIRGCAEHEAARAIVNAGSRPDHWSESIPKDFTVDSTTDKALQASWYFVKDYPLGSSLGVYGEFTCTPGISGKMK